MIKLQFSTSADTLENWASWVIRTMSHSKFSHVDVVLSDGLLGASDSPDAPIIEGNARGVAIRPGDYQQFGTRRLALVNCSAKVEERFIELVRSQIGEPFDNTALKAFMRVVADTGRDWRDASAWFCSELVAWGLEEAGFWPYEILVSKDRISPADLLLLINPAVINHETFWSPIPGLHLGPKEQ